MGTRRSDGDFRREIEAHLDLETERLIADGADPQEARSAALKRFGSVAAATERFYESRRLLWWDQLKQDTHYALRSFGRTPGFTLVAVLTIALGIGAATTIFSVVNAVLLRSLPYPGSDRLVRLLESPPSAHGAGVVPRPTGLNALEIAALRAQATTIQEVAIAQALTVRLSVGDQSMRLEGTRMSPALFDMLSVPLAAGRPLTRSDESAPSNNVLVLSYGTWHRLFGGDPSVVGTHVQFDGRPHTIVGVAARGFFFPDPTTHFWTPLSLPEGRLAAVQRMVPIAQLAEGATLDAARAEVTAIVGHLRRSGLSAPPPPPPPTAAGAEAAPPSLWAVVPPSLPEIAVVRLHDQMVASVRPALALLGGAVVLLLLIACVNVANLLLARSASRQRELAVRRALGASPSRLVRQVLTESLLLSLAGGIGGLLLAGGGVRLLQVLGTSLPRRDLAQGVGLPRINEVGIDETTFLLAAVASVVTGLLFAIGPALRHTHSGPAALLRDGSGSSGSGVLRRGRRTHGLLVVAEIAMATALSVGSGLLVRSFVNLLNVDPGYDSTNTLTFQVALPGAFSGTPVAFAEELTTRLRAVPGVRGVAYAENLPTINRRSGLVLRRTSDPPSIPPAPPAPGAPVPPETPDARFVSRDYLNVMGIGLVEGRGFGDPTGPRHLLINQALARSGYLGAHPIGTQIYALGPDPWEVAGIVEDVRQFGLDEDAPPQVFFDLQQASRLAADRGGSMPGRIEYFAVRTDAEPTRFVPAIREAVSDLDRYAAVENIATMDQIVANSILRPRLYTVVLGLVAGVAGVLAAIGIYGVMAYSVTERLREIGVRMALGAQRHTVLALVLRQSAVLTLCGIAAGLAGAAALSRYLEGLLFGLTPLDAITFAGVALLFGSIAAIASLVPARRATLVDPIVVLRCE